MPPQRMSPETISGPSPSGRPLWLLDVRRYLGTQVLTTYSEYLGGVCGAWLLAAARTGLENRNFQQGKSEVASERQKIAKELIGCK